MCVRYVIDAIPARYPLLYVSKYFKQIPYFISLFGEPDYFGRNKISSGGDLSHYSSASLY